MYLYMQCFRINHCHFPQDGPLSGKEVKIWSSVRNICYLFWVVNLYRSVQEDPQGGLYSTSNCFQFEATSYRNSSFTSELAYDNCTMTTLLFILHGFCSIYCLLSSWAQLQPLLHLLCPNYPFMDHNYLALQSASTALADHTHSVSGTCVSQFKIYPTYGDFSCSLRRKLQEKEAHEEMHKGGQLKRQYGSICHTTILGKGR